MCHELVGATLGVLGLGAVGEEIAWRAKAWGMEVIGTKRYPDSYEGSASEVYGPDDTVEVFGKADAVSARFRLDGERRLRWEPPSLRLWETGGS